MNEKERKNRDELFRLMRENPDLPVVAMVDSEIVAEMFRRQNSANQEYGLVLVVPKEVREKTAEMGPPSALKQQERPVIMEEMRQAMAGREDGEKFDPGHRLAAESCGGVKTDGAYCLA